MTQIRITMAFQNPKLPRLLLLYGIATTIAITHCLGANTASVRVKADRPTASVSSNLFGIFFEEINYGGDGGLYAELVRNRTFGNSANPDFWTLATSGTATGTMAVDTIQPLNTDNLSSLKLAMASGSGSVSAANSGYWGIALQSGATYDLSFYARGSSGFSGPVTVRLERADGSQLYAQATFSGLTMNWKRFNAPLVSSGTISNARLVFGLASISAVWLDDVSLLPRATFQGRTNGMRLDLANKLADLRPSFFRFPGGCYVEGNILANAFRWKRSIGDTATRPGHWNGVWNYFSTDGLGFHEYLQLCEDLGAEPLFGINCGMSHSEVAPMADMEPYVQDALDAIEYANGGTNTTWGALRAANGHPAPFHLKYMEIGNENGGASYNDRYALFYDAIKAAHPDIKLIACVWGGTPSSRPFDLMDEHYYTSPSTMASYATKYDSYGRSGAKVFVGEYAVTSGHGTYGNLAAALGEAAFMTGLERNSDIVELACYAPLFANVNGMQWHPNLINFDSLRSFGTPSYYVQKMFSQNRGDVVLPVSVAGPANLTNPPSGGAIGVGSWNTSVQYTNIVVTSNGVTLYASDFVNQGANGWSVYNGAWSVSGGCYQQTSTTTVDCRSTIGSTNWANYTLSLRARKTGGSEGFLILLNWRDDNNWTWLNLGGWGNTQHGIEQNVNGSKSLLGTRSFGSIQTDQWYDIVIVLSGLRIQCYLNGTLIQDVTNPAYSPGGLYASSLYNQASREVILKTVNFYEAPLETTFDITGVPTVFSSATLIQLTSGSLQDENSLAVPANVSPLTNVINNAGTNFTLTLPANSLSILRLQLDSPLPPNGFRAGTAGWQVALSWWRYGGATNYIVRRATTSGGPYTLLASTPGTSCLDTNVVVGTTYYYVLTAALPTGETPPTGEVSATAGATLLAYLPFDETSGTIAADVTGHGWDGTLVNSPAWVTGHSNNAVNLNSSSRYVRLPSGVASDLTDFSLTAWVMLNSASTWSRIFDFGSGTTSYMFLTPQSGGGTLRFAITTNGNGSEQQINGPAILPTNGWHHLAVTLCGGIGTLYVDGARVGSNTTMTLTPADLGNSTQNWIGRSQWAPDPYINGMVDEFRIYRGALTAGEVETFLIPLVAPSGLNATAGNAQVALAWNASARANGYTVRRSTSPDGPFTVIASNVVNLAITDSSVVNWTTYYYVVSALNAIGESSASPQVSAHPVSPTPPNVAFTLSADGKHVTLSWPTSYLGSRLESNSVGLIAAGNWFTVSDSASTNWMAIPINPSSSNVFFRLVFP